MKLVDSWEETVNSLGGIFCFQKFSVNFAKWMSYLLLYFWVGDVKYVM